MGSTLTRVGSGILPYLSDLNRRLDAGELRTHEPTAEEQQAEAEAAWLDAWRATVPGRWCRLVEELDAGEIPKFDWYKIYTARWHARRRGDSGIVFGSTNSGKSVAAAACLRGDAEKGRSIAWLSATSIPRLVDARSPQLAEARYPAVLVLDEVGSLLDAPWRYWVEVDGLVKDRYALDRSTLMLTTSTPKQTAARFGPEVIRRFPEPLRVVAKED